MDEWTPCIEWEWVKSSLCHLRKRLLDIHNDLFKYSAIDWATNKNIKLTHLYIFFQSKLFENCMNSRYAQAGSQEPEILPFVSRKKKKVGRFSSRKHSVDHIHLFWRPTTEIPTVQELKHGPIVTEWIHSYRHWAPIKFWQIRNVNNNFLVGNLRVRDTYKAINIV